jgi:hypothetical protein
MMRHMDQRSAERLVDAATLLRGDLADLLPEEEWPAVDAALCEAISGAPDDLIEAAGRVRVVVNPDPSLAARLRTFERELATDSLALNDNRTAGTGFQGPPGHPGVVPAPVWSCPQQHDVPFRRKQRFPDQDMGICPDHGVRLVEEDSGL